MDLSRYSLELLRSDESSALWRGRARGCTIDGSGTILVRSAAVEDPRPESLRRLEHEYRLRSELDPAWAARPLALARLEGRPALVLEDVDEATPLSAMLGKPLDLVSALQLGAALASVIDRMHRGGLVHKDINPANVLVHPAKSRCWLTGFGICSRLPAEHAEPPDLVAGSFAYVAPEQTGRMNLSIDGRTDLYSLGVILHEMLTGELPFVPADLPGPVSTIVTRLLARSAKDRYGTAAGVARDLQHCLDEWRSNDRIPPFALGQHETPARPTLRDGFATTPLDLATIIDVAGAFRGETVLEKVIDTLMRTAIEHAGAQRGVLWLSQGLDREVHVEATTSGDSVTVGQLQTARASLPETIVRCVTQTRETVVLEDALADGRFADDPYIEQHRPRSVVCLPLVYRAKLLAILYLENRVAPRVFSPLRLTVLELLGSQAAIALENTHLYRDLQTREVQIRRLVDANILGIFVYRMRGDVVDANEAFLQMLGYTRDDLLSGNIAWADLTPAEWAAQDQLAFAELNATGTVRAYEKEYFRKDGSRVPILIGGATFGGTDTGVCMVFDISERKRAQEALQRRDAELAKAQAELAHVSRVTTLGELAASIAHEVSQPVAGIVHNAIAGLRWLSRDPPEAHELETALQRIVRDAERASEVVHRLRRLSRKAAVMKEPVNINDAIAEVLALTRGEALRKSVRTRTQLTGEVPIVQVDRVQIQQVALNLIVNAIDAMGMSGERRELLVCSESCSDLAQRWPEAGAKGALHTSRHHLVVSISDTGPGLDPAQLQSVFTPFYTTKADGLGMGLSISRSIIEAHGGLLWAGCEPHAGAVFRFALPIETE